MDWATISSLATAGGTLVLAVATFASVRTSNRSARLAERAFEIGVRPLVTPSRLDDPPQKIRWVDDHMAKLEGGRASVELVDGNIYMAMSLRNAGSGIAMLQAWKADPEFKPAELRKPPSQEQLRPQSRDLYIASGDVAFWQAAIRDANDPLYPGLASAIEERRRFIVYLLYSDHEDGQHTISLFTLTPGNDSNWLVGVARHWNLERPELWRS